MAGENCHNEVNTRVRQCPVCLRVSEAAMLCSHCLYQDQAIIIIIINSALPTFSPKIEWDLNLCFS